MATASAIINVKKGCIGLNARDLVMNIYIEKMVRRSMIDGQTFLLGDFYDLAKEVLRDRYSKDPLERALTTSASEAGYLDELAAGYVIILDESE